MAYFPMFVDLTDRPCLVVGGGQVAYRKVKVLLDFDARVTVVADCVCHQLRELESEEKEHLVIYKRRFIEDDCQGKTLVVAATDDEKVNHDIADVCKSAGIMVNAVDQKDDCSFIFSSYVREQNLVAAFSSSGKSPVISQYLKKKESDILTPFLGELNEYMGSIRSQIIAEYDNEEERKRAFCDIVYSAIENNKLP